MLDSRPVARAQGPWLRLTPGLLETPRFRPGLPWLSGTVQGGDAGGGTPLEGSISLALETPSPPAALHRAAAAAARLRAERLGGQCWADAPSDALLTDSGPGLALVIATPDGTQSGRMLTAALGRTGAARTLVLLPERDEPPGFRDACTKAGCRIAELPLDPWPLLACAAEVHAAPGDMIATLASLVGIQTYSNATLLPIGHGFPPATLPAAVLIMGSSYADPYTGAPSTVERALDVAAEWRRTCDQNRKVAVCVGMQFWKRRRIAQFLHTGVRPPAFRHGAEASAQAAKRRGGAIAAWASRMPPGLAEAASRDCVPMLRVEDGFLRSVGLGSDFNLPCSIVLDGSGLYYDPAQPSDLEHLLAASAFTPALLDRARALIGRLVLSGLTKYNTGAASLPSLPANGRRTILVTGQVADDLSVRLGGGAVTSNIDLLRHVRAANPDAYIVYKSHPDVDAGHRPGVIPDSEALSLADALARGAPMGALIGAVDELNTMTSLAGFEALLRGRHVVVWGRPFYAGWGLTADMAAIPRRTRRLTLEELAAGVLLLYPRYLDPVTGLPCPPEVLLDRMADPGLWQPGLLVRARRLQGRVHAAFSRPSRTTQPGRV